MLTRERRPERALSLEACDPKRLIRDALETPGPAPALGWSARELYLAWLMALPVEIDAAHAAALLISCTRPAPTTDRSVRDLLDLLRMTTAYPRERLTPAGICRSKLH